MTTQTANLTDNAGASRGKQAFFNRFAEEQDTDIFLLNGTFGPELLELSSIYQMKAKRKNLLLLMVTPGGSPHLAYAFIRRLQYAYEKLTLFVTGPCKSAGTLAAIGAYELVFAETGELGPLDIQLAKEDDPLAMESGLLLMETLDCLETKAFKTIVEKVSKLREGTGGIISLQTATSLVNTVISALYSPMLSKLDPVKIGEMNRALKIMEEYGKRLLERYENITPDALTHLIEGYPSHQFVIDEHEARNLFNRVRKPTAAETLLLTALGDHARIPALHAIRTLGGDFRYLNTDTGEKISSLAKE